MSSPELTDRDTRQHRGELPRPRRTTTACRPRWGNSVSRTGEFQVSVNNAAALRAVAVRNHTREPWDTSTLCPVTRKTALCQLMRPVCWFCQ